MKIKKLILVFAGSLLVSSFSILALQEKENQNALKAKLRRADGLETVSKAATTVSKVSGAASVGSFGLLGLIGYFSYKSTEGTDQGTASALLTLLSAAYLVPIGACCGAVSIISYLIGFRSKDKANELRADQDKKGKADLSR